MVSIKSALTFLSFGLALGLLASCVSTPARLLEFSEVEAWVSQQGLDAKAYEKTIQGQNFELTEGKNQLKWRQYTPERPVWDGVIFVSHGFLRSLEAMDGWGRLLASSGFRAVVTSFKRSSLLNGAHEANAKDLLALADTLAPQQKRIYMGFSAGGLSSIITASDDELARGLIGLDAVDSGDLAQKALVRFSLPSLFLWGGPAACNAKNNMKLPLERAWKGLYTSIDIPSASHCHFEAPYDTACASFCGTKVSAEGTKLLQYAIQTLVVKWLGSELKID